MSFASELLLPSMKGWKQSNGLWYIGDRLLIPRVTGLREALFQLAHNVLGHFGADKLYTSLRDAYYWPNMRRDLEQAYIPSCQDCLRNKSQTTKLAGPLHPLPVPDERGQSVAMDFVGPLPMDQGFDCLYPSQIELVQIFGLYPQTRLYQQKNSLSSFSTTGIAKTDCQQILFATGTSCLSHAFGRR